MSPLLVGESPAMGSRIKLIGQSPGLIVSRAEAPLSHGIWARQGSPVEDGGGSGKLGTASIVIWADGRCHEIRFICMGARAPGTVAATRDMSLLLQVGSAVAATQLGACVDARATPARALAASQANLGLAASLACKSKTLAIKTMIDMALRLGSDRAGLGAMNGVDIEPVNLVLLRLVRACAAPELPRWYASWCAKAVVVQSFSTTIRRPNRLARSSLSVQAEWKVALTLLLHCLLVVIES